MVMHVAFSIFLLLASAAVPAVSGLQSLSAQSGGSGGPSGDSGISAKSIRALPVDARIAIDGELDEPEWERADAASDFVQQVPKPGQPATFATEAAVLITSDAIYVGVRLDDPAPDSIVAHMARRDVLAETDRVYVAFDSHLDRRTAFEFGVNAAGVKRDLRISDDDREDDSWDAVWDVAVARGERGWTAEFKIPLSQLRFDAGEGEQSWGLNVRRVVPRRGEVSSWAPVLSNSGSYVSSFGTLTGLLIAQAPRRFELFPYVTTRAVHAPGDPANPYYRATDLTAGVGADIRLGLTSWLGLTGTVNPDFGQVEADPSVVNLSAFEVFLPERRPFFIEGAEYFRTPASNLFYSRRIGRRPQLRAPTEALYSERQDRTTILGAGKLTGRAPSGWSIGMLGAVTADEQVSYTTDEGEASIAVEPRTAYSVARIGRDFREGRSGINITGTSTNRFLGQRPAMKNLHEDAFAGGIDGRHRFHDDQLELSGSFYVSHVRGDSAAISRTQRSAGRYFQRPDADHLTFQTGRTALSGRSSSVGFAKVAGGNWRAGVRGSSVSPGFEINDLGRQSRVDRLQTSAWVRYQEFDAGPLFRRWMALGRQGGIWTHGGEQVDVHSTLEAEAEFHNRWRVGLWGMRHLGGVDPDRLRGGPAYFKPGIWMGRIFLATDANRPLAASASLFADVRDEAEGGRWNFSSSLRWRPSSRADVRLRPRISRRTDASQFVTRKTIQATSSPRYILAEIDQTTVSLAGRLNYAISPNLTLELHAEPFIATGEYGKFKAVVPEAASDPNRDRRLIAYDSTRLRISEGSNGRRVLEIDETGDGTVDIRLPHPDFSRKNLRSTAVLRWEFRPASTLFLVWSHDRSRLDRDGQFDPIRDSSLLRRAPGRNIIALKASYRLGW